MLSTKDLFRIILSLVLINIFSAGSLELRLAIATLTSWAVDLILHHHLALSPTFLHRHTLFIFASLWLLAAYNNLFYQNAIGLPLDLFFERDPLDLETAGSGFAVWLGNFPEQHEGLMRLLRIIFLTLVVITISLFLTIAMLLDSIASTSDFSSAEGTAQVQAPGPEPKHDTRYVYLSDELIFVCGRHGGFESVVAGDLEAAIRRRRPVEPAFGRRVGVAASRPQGRRMGFHERWRSCMISGVSSVWICLHLCN